MGKDEDKIIAYAERKLLQRQYEKLSKKDVQCFMRLAQGRCGKCGEPLEVIACYHASIKGEYFALSCCGHVVWTVPYEPNSGLKTSRFKVQFGDHRYSIHQFEKNKPTKEQRERDLARKFTEKEYSEYEDLKNDEEYSPIDIIARKMDSSGEILLQITTLIPGEKLWEGMYVEGYKNFKYDLEGIESDLKECISKKRYDRTVCNKIILLINTWPLVPEKVKEGLSGKASQLLHERNYHEVWLIHEETSETVRIWPN